MDSMVKKALFEQAQRKACQELKPLLPSLYEMYGKHLIHQHLVEIVDLLMAGYKVEWIHSYLESTRNKSQRKEPKTSSLHLEDVPDEIFRSHVDVKDRQLDKIETKDMLCVRYQSPSGDLLGQVVLTSKGIKYYVPAGKVACSSN